MPDPAPFRADLAEGPANAAACWIETADKLRLRLVRYPAAGGGTAGTVFLLPGRTEYAEKYGRTARGVTAAGFNVLAIDWRGQGLSDRLTRNPMVGHVTRFSDYQLDWAAMVKAARNLALPKPWHMLAHSMGGCIGLRALIEGAQMASAVFTGPMWGIHMSPYLRPVAWSLSHGGSALGMGHFFAPGMSTQSYVLTQPFENNLLTTDPDMYDYLKRQVAEEPRFGLGAPSLRWMAEALTETRRLADLASPALPALCFVGSNERIVDTTRIRERMTRWPGGKLLLVDGAEHELLMEKPHIRKQVLGAALSLFRGAGKASG